MIPSAAIAPGDTSDPAAHDVPSSQPGRDVVICWSALAADGISPETSTVPDTGTPAP